MAGGIFQEAEYAANTLIAGKEVVGEAVAIKAADTGCMAYPEQLAGIEVEGEYFGGGETVAGGEFGKLVVKRGHLSDSGMLGVYLAAAQAHQEEA
ncbi:hypothetical protein D3H65_18535 [Paraflavitalea soli]|uniref:Uncharacterized protein n=1 Tax=Paraflavitalea soli TaxID=2315862 RepID=A0A3B7MN23_9BACT|nr:hypothetical protein D3H65_18535 [Paraflavitalea soli]